MPDDVDSAFALTVPDSLLNLVAALVVGEGQHLEPVVQQLELPMLGEVTVRLSPVVHAASVICGEGDAERVSIAIDGLVGVSLEGESSLPVPDAPIPVRLSARCRPVVEITESSLLVGVDLRTAEFGDTEVVTDPDNPDPVAQAAGFIFAGIGDDLMRGLGEQLGSVEREIPLPAPAADLGLSTGPAHVEVAPGELHVRLGSATPRAQAGRVPVEGQRIGVSLGGSTLAAVLSWLAATQGGLGSVPFDLRTQASEQGLAGRLRPPRLLPAGFPELRPGVRTDLGIRLDGDHVYLGVRSAWVELPWVPAAVNRFSRAVGGVASSLPEVRIASVIEVPVPGGDPWPVRIVSVTTAEDRVDIVVDLGLD